MGSTGKRFFPPAFCHSSKVRDLKLVIPTFPKFFPLFLFCSLALSFCHCSLDMPLSETKKIKVRLLMLLEKKSTFPYTKTNSRRNVFHGQSSIILLSLSKSGTRKGRGSRECCCLRCCKEQCGSDSDWLHGCQNGCIKLLICFRIMGFAGSSRVGTAQMKCAGLSQSRPKNE